MGICIGDAIPKTPQDVLVGAWFKQALIKLNPAIQANPDYADEVIYKLRAVFLDAKHTGLVKANENFYEWLKAEKSLPFGVNGEHVTIHMIDYNNLENNHYVVSKQVHFIAATEAYFDIVLYVNGIPLVVGEMKTATRPAISWEDGAVDFCGGTKNYWNNVAPFCT